jgi:hypothetical protein
LGVYGQPIDVYPRLDSRDELRRLTDGGHSMDVLSGVLKKSHECIIEERKK